MHILQTDLSWSFRSVSFAVVSFVRLYAKLLLPGDSEVTFSVFESSCHLLLLV